VVNNQNWTWNNQLDDVSAVSPTDIWAVGSAQSSWSGSFVNTAEHWDGTSWAISARATNGPGDDYLNGVDAITSTNIWAVGVAHVNAIPEGSFQAWGSSASINSYDPNPITATVLNDVGAIDAQHVLMVGAILDTNTFTWQTLIKFWRNGQGPDPMPSQNLGTGDNALFGIDVVSPTDIWAVGYYRPTPSSPRRTLFEHSTDGFTWSVVPSPNSGMGDNTLLSMSATSSSDFWAVGYTGSTTTGRLLLEHWTSGTWTVVTPGNPGAYTNVLTDVVATSSTSYAAVGFYAQSSSLYLPLAAQFNGTAWALSNAASASSDSLLFGVVAPAAGDMWAVGTFLSPKGLNRNLIENYSGLAPPGTPTAAPGDRSATLSWSAPCGDGGSAITSYVVTAYDGCSIQGSLTVSPPNLNTNFTGLTNGVAYTFTVAAVNGFGASPASSPSIPMTPTGPSAPKWASACSARQYQLSASDGRTWQAMDSTNLSVSLTPTVDSFAVVSGNADLWTANAGYNQDIGVEVSGGMYPTVSGQPEAWKESGGYGGTFSPNAAYVQTVIPLVGLTTYTAKLTWKANKPDAGSIFAGAGPIEGAFSPTRLTVQLIPKSANTVFSVSSTSQYGVNGVGGSHASWIDIDSAKLKLSFPVPGTGNWTAFVSGNADLWTTTAGYNQDLGVTMIGGTQYPPTGNGDSQAWKESGGLSGTFSPNAAFVQAPFAVTSGTTYTAKLQWKPNIQDPYFIWAGAGPIGGRFSPTTLTVILVPADPTISLMQANYGQLHQPNSDGAYWEQFSDWQMQPVPGSFASQAILRIAPSVDSDYLLSLNSDLWTSAAGYNQDMGILVSGGAYGPPSQVGSGGYGLGPVVAWKESGGGSAYSPNAAFATTVVHLQGGQIYWVLPVWKANRLAESSNAIWAGAGPIPFSPDYSPSWLMATQLG
jgi:hypothetical protein